MDGLSCAFLFEVYIEKALDHTVVEEERAGNMTFRSRTVALMVAAAMALGSLLTALFFMNEETGTMPNQVTSKSDAYKNYEEKLKKTFDTIRGNYVRPISEQALMDGALRGMIQALGDPHSEYMNPKEAKQFLSSIMNSSFSGIGAGVVLKDGQVTIESIVKDSPAEHVGLRVNDQIRKVNGQSIVGLTLNEAVSKIRGPKGTKVTLEVVRGGSAPFSITAVRKDIPQKTVSNKMLDNRIGYVGITQFSQTTDKEFFTSLAQLEKQKMKGLIIDLRGNPGGLLSVVVKMCEQLLPEGKIIVSTQDKAGNKEVYRAKAKELKSYPITILVDGSSASAAEIMAAAFQQSGGYSVIGQKTYGKGSVQSSIEFTDGSNLKLTIAKWLTPKGIWIDQHGGTKGLSPNIDIAPFSFAQAHLPEGKQVWKKDSNGTDVKNMQLILDALGFKPGRMDGYFDTQTETALKNFQKSHDIPDNGLLDAQTVKYLGIAYTSLLRDPKNDKQLQTAIQFLEHSSE
ncbi:S41 family peptidase [Shimazuella kribbensis]|uniref:S41 family peptidase n=1 Tax=Shimazuella kribbensis TaxID=139808 RepID=UPI000428CFEF|nr:S41 family peptidase [Shimazuella kribbensis]